MNAVYTVSKFALKLGVLWGKFSVDILVIRFFQFGQSIAVIIVIVIAVLSNVAVALLPRLSPPCCL